MILSSGTLINVLLYNDKYPASIIVLDFESIQENGKLDFYFPFALCNLITQWTQCTHLIPETKEEIKQVLYLCPYKNVGAVQELKRKLSSLSPNIGGIVAFNITDGSARQDYRPWLCGDPPLYVVGKENGQKLLELSQSQDVQIQPATISAMSSTEHILPMVRVLPLSGGNFCNHSQLRVS